MNTTSIIFLTVIITTCVLGLFFLVWKFGQTTKDLQDQVTSSRQTIDELTQQVNLLEAANRLRLPHKAMLKAINAMAALDILEDEADFKKSLIKNAKGQVADFIATGTTREKP